LKQGRNWFERQVEAVEKEIDSMPSFMLRGELLSERADKNRVERIQALITFFVSSYMEGRGCMTDFDRDLIETLNNLKAKYRQKPAVCRFLLSKCSARNIRPSH